MTIYNAVERLVNTASSLKITMYVAEAVLFSKLLLPRLRDHTWGKHI